MLVFFWLEPEGTVEIPGVVSDLEASFAAALRRDEDQAADDLARSLVCEQSLARAVSYLQDPEALSTDGRRLAVFEIAEDHLLARPERPTCVPFASAVIRGQPGGSTPDSKARITRSTRTLSQRLRDWSQRGATVRVVTARGTYEGALTRATKDHLALTSPSGETCVAYRAVHEVALLEADHPLSLEVKG